VIDTTTDTVTDTISVGKVPWGVAFTPNGKAVYVTNSEDNTVSVIDTTNNKVTKTISGFDDPLAFGIFIKP
jgi:YVTN family beta-propeller protein